MRTPERPLRNSILAISMPSIDCPLPYLPSPGSFANVTSPRSSSLVQHVATTNAPEQSPQTIILQVASMRHRGSVATVVVRWPHQSRFEHLGKCLCPSCSRLKHASNIIHPMMPFCIICLLSLACYPARFEPTCVSALAARAS